MRRPERGPRGGRGLACLLALATVLSGASAACIAAAVVRVGAGESITSIGEAARRVRHGIVEIEAGDYIDDVAVWEGDEITVRGIGGRVRILSTRVAEGKGIWVVRSARFTVENVEFHNAISEHGDAAGIRLESGRMLVRNCLFARNQVGILTANREEIELVVIGSEFTDNYSYQLVSHQLYVGRIGRFEMRESYLHKGYYGHLLKSRARENRVLYNRLTDEAHGSASYEMEFPDGGIVVALGNLVEQSARTGNSAMVSFGAESLRWPVNELNLAHNTLVNDYPGGGSFVFVRRGAQAVRLVNNLWVGRGIVDAGLDVERAGNHYLDPRHLADAVAGDYRLRETAPVAARASAPGEVHGFSLRPTHEYDHPRGSRRVPESLPLQPGALQTTAP